MKYVKVSKINKLGLDRIGRKEIMKRKFISILLASVMTLSLVACGGSSEDTAGWDSVLKDTQDAGTQVILFDRTIDADESLYAASIVSDMDKEGETAANWLKDQKLDEYNIIHIQGVMGFDCNKWALEELLAQNWNYDGQCNPFQASYIADVIEKLEAGEEITEKTIIMDEKGFDATTITEEDVEQYGI